MSSVDERKEEGDQKEEEEEKYEDAFEDDTEENRQSQSLSPFSQEGSGYKESVPVYVNEKDEQASGQQSDDNEEIESIFDLNPAELFEEGERVTNYVINTLLPKETSNPYVKQFGKPSIFETEILQRLFLNFADKCVRHGRLMIEEDVEENKDRIINLSQWVVEFLHDRRLFGSDAPQLSPRAGALKAKVLSQAYNNMADVERAQNYLHSALRHLEEVLKYEGVLLKKTKENSPFMYYESESKASPEEVVCVDTYNVRIPVLPMFPPRCQILAQSIRSHLNTASAISLLERHEDAYSQAQVAVSMAHMYQGDPEQYGVPDDDEEAASWDLLFSLLLGQAYYAVAAELEFQGRLEEANEYYGFSQNALAPLHKNRKVRRHIATLDGGDISPKKLYEDMKALEESCEKAHDELSKTIQDRTEMHQKRGETRERNRVASRYAQTRQTTTRKPTELSQQTRKNSKSAKAKGGKDGSRETGKSRELREKAEKILQEFATFEDFETNYTPPEVDDFFAVDVEQKLLNNLKARSGLLPEESATLHLPEESSQSERIGMNSAPTPSTKVKVSSPQPQNGTSNTSLQGDKSWNVWDEAIEDAEQKYEDMLTLHPEGTSEKDELSFAHWLTRRIEVATSQMDKSTRGLLKKAAAGAISDDSKKPQSEGRATIFDEARENASRRSSHR